MRLEVEPSRMMQDATERRHDGRGWSAVFPGWIRGSVLLCPRNRARICVYLLPFPRVPKRYGLGHKPLESNMNTAL